MSDVRVRFAPSPTGHLHTGGARTALFVYLFAKKYDGVFVLRVEDTDEERSTEESMRSQMADLDWLGLHWDEGIHKDSLEDQGEYGPYRQSQRLDIYKKYADELLEKGLAYYCFLSDEEIEVQREAAQAEGRPPQVDSPYKNLSLEEAQKKIAAGESAVVRFKVPEDKKEYQLQDMVRGEVTFPSDMVGDFVLLRSTGMPVYNFCCVVDDALMKISHVFRAEDHLSNTVRQMMIYEALDWPIPKFAHLSLILGEDRKKLSKRHGADSVSLLREEGYLPDAILNFLALLGWSPPDTTEVMTLEEITQKFSTDRLNPAGAVFDHKKLKWMNSQHLRNMDHNKLWELLTELLEKEKISLKGDTEWKAQVLNTFKTSMEVLNDGVELLRPLDSSQFSISEKGKEVAGWESSSAVIQKWVALVAETPKDFLTEEQFMAIQDQIKEQCEVKGKFLFMPIRVAVIGEPQGAELKQLVPLIHKDDLLKRAKAVLDL